MPSKRPEQLGPKVGQAETEAGKIRDEYAKEKFYISSTDKHHNNERIRLSNDPGARTLRVPPFVWALIAKWVDDDATPYRSASDLIRDATVHRLHQLQEIADAPADATWRGMRLQVEMYRRVEESTRHRDMVDGTKQMMNEAWAGADIALYNDLTKSAAKLAVELPSPYREELEGYLKDQKNVRRLSASE